MLSLWRGLIILFTKMKMPCKSECFRMWRTPGSHREHSAFPTTFARDMTDNLAFYLLDHRKHSCVLTRLTGQTSSLARMALRRDPGYSTTRRHVRIKLHHSLPKSHPRSSLYARDTAPLSASHAHLQTNELRAGHQDLHWDLLFPGQKHGLRQYSSSASRTLCLA